MRLYPAALLERAHLSAPNARVHARALALALCASQGAIAADHVRDIVADKWRYLKDSFSTAAISKSVVEVITKADSGNVNFHKVVFTEVPHFTKSTSSAVPPDYRVTLTYVSIGGPFVGVLDELFANGFPTTQVYSLTYRSILFLDTQSVTLSAQDAPQSFPMKNLKVFSPVAVAIAGSGDFEWRFQVAPHVQLMNFKDTYFHCNYGTVYPASKINGKLQGDAQDLDCEQRNDNNVVTNHSTVSILQYYGIGITRAKMTTSSTIEFNVEGVQID